MLQFDVRVFEKRNQDDDFPKTNAKGRRIVIGCNYHTNWQSSRSMRFVLTDVKDGKAKLQTRHSKKTFWTELDDLIFIKTETNMIKAERLTKKGKYWKEDTPPNGQP